MANVKITNLPSLTGASSASDDVLPVVDISTDTTSKMTRAEFFKNVPSPSLTGQVSLDDGSAAAPSLTNTGDTNTGLFFPAEDTVGLGTGGTERLRVDASGVVTITNGVLDLSSGYPIRWGGAASGIYSGSGTQDMLFTAGSAERMRINGLNGNVGIGTSSPTAKLDVSGVSSVVKISRSSGNHPKLAFGSTTFTDFYLQGDSATGILRYDAGAVASWGGIHAWFTDTAERMRIDASGNVGIGVSSPSAKLDVTGINGAIKVASGGIGGYYGIKYDPASAGSRSWAIYSDHTAFADFNILTSATQTGATSVSRFYIDASGNVGIGTTSPNQKLVVEAATGGTTARFRNTTAGNFIDFYETTGSTRQGYVGVVNTDNFALWNDKAGYTVFGTNALERMRIDSTGNVGIGTSSPAYKLRVQTAPTTSSFDGISLSDGVFDVVGLYKTGATYSFGMVGANQSWIYSNRGDLNIMSDTDGGAIKFATGGNTERMRIDASGNVGIGTDTYASARVHINSTSPSGFEDTGNTLRLTCSASSTAAAGATGAGLVFAQQWLSSGGGLLRTGGIYGLKTAGDGNFGGGLAFYTQPNAAVPMAERARIDASGNLLVGTTTRGSLASTNSFDLDVQDGNIYCTHASGTPSGYYYISFGYGASNVIGSIVQNGTTGVSYNTSSDYRLKENVAPMQNALDTVAQLNPVTYTWKADGSDGQGFIAHELQAVVPDCVTGEKDAVDDEGNPKYQGVDTSFLVATLVKAIQELKAEVDSLRAQLNP